MASYEQQCCRGLAPISECQCAQRDAQRDGLTNLLNRAQALSCEVQKRERFEEEVWCAHKWLDEQGVPRSDVGGEVFSLVGRMMRLVQISRT